MKYVILRDDDTCAVTPAECLDRLYAPFLERSLPVHLAVIPDVNTAVRQADGRPEGFLLGKESAAASEMPVAGNRELVAYLRSRPGYRIVQHGYKHDYFEFDGRDAAELGRRLDEGRLALMDAGFATPRVFVAPYDKLSRDGYREVAKRFRLLSTGWFELGRVPPAWWPRYFLKKLGGQPHWEAGGLVMLSHPGCLLSCHKPYDSMFQKVQESVESRPLTVLVTHWWEYFRDGRADEAFIAVLHEVGKWLASRSDIQVVTFDDVADGRVPID